MILANLLDLSKIRLLYADTHLEDTDKLSYHGIKDKSTHVLALRVPERGEWRRSMDFLIMVNIIKIQDTHILSEAQPGLKSSVNKLK